jgi:hypothetical protein
VSDLFPETSVAAYASTDPKNKIAEIHKGKTLFRHALFLTNDENILLLQNFISHEVPNKPEICKLNV